MCLWTLALLSSMLSLSTVAADDGKPLTPAEATKKVGEAVTVEIAVKSAAMTKNGVCFLNSEEDFKSAKNFAVFLDRGVVAKFKDAGIADPAAHFKGKTVTVRGKVTLFKDRPELVLGGPDAIKAVGK